MPEFFETLYKGMIARDRFDSPVWINKVSTTISHMSNRDLLTDDQRGCQCCPTARGLALNGALSFTHRRLHDLLKRFIHRIRFDMKEIRMKFAQNIACYG